MLDYEFALRFRLPDPDTDPETLLGALQAAGCEDATVGIGKKGRIAFEFTRTASSARSAMESAIAAVRQAIPGAELLEATPDYVGVTDIADLFGVSRQYVQGEIADHIRTFPAPVHEGSAALYHLAKVLVWYQSVRHRSVDRQMFEVAQAAMHVNVEKEYESLATAD